MRLRLAFEGIDVPTSIALPVGTAMCFNKSVSSLRIEATLSEDIIAGLADGIAPSSGLQELNLTFFTIDKAFIPTVCFHRHSRGQQLLASIFIE